MSPFAPCLIRSVGPQAPSLHDNHIVAESIEHRRPCHAPSVLDTGALQLAQHVICTWCGHIYIAVVLQDEASSSSLKCFSPQGVLCACVTCCPGASAYSHGSVLLDGSDL